MVMEVKKPPRLYDIIALRYITHHHQNTVSHQALLQQ